MKTFTLLALLASASAHAACELSQVDAIQQAAINAAPHAQCKVTQARRNLLRTYIYTYMSCKSSLRNGPDLGAYHYFDIETCEHIRKP